MQGKGVDAGRLSIAYFGESMPAADNTSAAGMAENRRTVVDVTKSFLKK